MLASLGNPALLGAIFLFNAMRGRDKSSEDVRREHAQTAASLTGSPLHRGAILWAAMTQRRLSGDDNAAFNSYKSKSGQVFDSVVFKLSGATVEESAFMRQRMTEMEAQLHTIKAEERVRFEAVLHECRQSLLHLASVEAAGQEFMRSVIDDEAIRAVRARISAVLAHRTMRLAA
jgi:hypothetical protein